MARTVDRQAASDPSLVHRRVRSNRAHPSKNEIGLVMTRPAGIDISVEVFEELIGRNGDEAPPTFLGFANAGNLLGCNVIVFSTAMP